MRVDNTKRVTAAHAVVRHGNRWLVAELEETDDGYYYSVLIEAGAFMSYDLASAWVSRHTS